MEKRGGRWALHTLRAFSILSLILFLALYLSTIPLTILFVGVGLPVFITALIPLWRLSKKEREFKTSYRITMLSFIASIAFFIAFFLLASSSNTVYSNVSFFDAFFLSTSGVIAFAMLSLAFASLFSISIGMALGLWRIGIKHKSRAIKLGAVLFIIPILDMAGALLLILGLFSLKRLS